jgi:hypothetical protein
MMMRNLFPWTQNQIRIYFLAYVTCTQIRKAVHQHGENSNETKRACPGTDLHLGLAVDLEIVQSILGHRRTGLIGVFHESNVSLGRDKTDFDEVGVSGGTVAAWLICVSGKESCNRETRSDSLLEDVLQILLCCALGQVLQEQDLVGREVFVGHLDGSSGSIGNRLTRCTRVR